MTERITAAHAGLVDFIAESNRIEGIDRCPTDQEIIAHEKIMSYTELKPEFIEEFVEEVAGAKLRSQAGMNVQVGNHIPIGGGFVVRNLFNETIEAANNAKLSPYVLHHRYETLHPFMDGNGRSGRVLWLWMMQKQLGVDNMNPIYGRGFLHSWYYQSLSEKR